MDDLLNDILAMRNLGQMQITGAAGTPSLLETVRDRAVSDLSAVFAQTLELSAGDLMDLAGRNPTHVMYCLYMDTRDQILNHQENLINSFRRQLFQRFNDARRRGIQQPEPHASLAAADFNLVEPEELEMTLAGNTVSHALQVSSSDALPGLDRRLGLLLDDPELRLGPNPIAPEVIGETLMEAIRSLSASNKVKLMLVTRINTHLPPRVLEVYAKLNTLLIRQGVLPAIRHELRRATPAAAGTPTQVSPQDASQGNARPQGSQADTFAMLQQLMSMGRIGATPGLAAPGTLPVLPGSGMAEAANEGEIDSGQVLQRLTQIQQGDMGNMAIAGVDPGVLVTGQVNVLRAIKNTGAAGQMGSVDAMTLDIVALMFDYILDDHRLPDAMKALIGRLQIPILKVAMLDKAFFSQKSHPARRLLDALADAALGWDEAEGRESPLYQMVDGLVQRVLNDFEDKVDIFATVLEELRQFLSEEKRLADERACHSAQILQNNEQAALARSIALEAVQTRLLDSNAPEFIHVFLQDTWANYLGGLYLRGGADGEAWRKALATMDDLLWSLTPKVAKEERQRLVALLPGLLKQLDGGIHATHQTREARDRFFSNLVKYHAEAVNAGMQGRSQVRPEEPRRPIITPATCDEAYVFDTPGFHEVPEPGTELETDDRILREISSVPAGPMETEEIVIGDVVGQDRLAMDGPAEEAYFDKQVRELKRGTWIEFTLDDHSTLRAKLAWVSPLRGTYLFTNRLGERAVSINASGLAHKLRQGQARIVDSVALVDRAVSSLFERLQKHATAQA